jgi:hypothetical protein
LVSKSVLNRRIGISIGSNLAGGDRRIRGGDPGGRGIGVGDPGEKYGGGEAESAQGMNVGCLATTEIGSGQATTSTGIVVVMVADVYVCTFSFTTLD